MKLVAVILYVKIRRKEIIATITYDEEPVRRQSCPACQFNKKSNQKVEEKLFLFSLHVNFETLQT